MLTNPEHLWTALAGVILAVVAGFWPNLQEPVSQALTVLGVLVAAVFGGHVVGQVHRSIREGRTVHRP